MKKQLMFAVMMAFTLSACAQTSHLSKAQQHPDKPFVQDYSVKYLKENPSIHLYEVAADRNGYIQLLSSQGLLRLHAAQFLYPGPLVTDVQYRPTSDKSIAAMGTYENELVYIDDKTVFSDAWAGRLYSRDSISDAHIYRCGGNSVFLIFDGMKIG